MQPESAQREHYSLDKRVDHHTPPTFLLHAVDDPAVKVENSLAMFNALHAHQVPVEMHLFEQGRHGFGLWDPRCAGFAGGRMATVIDELA